MPQNDDFVNRITYMYDEKAQRAIDQFKGLFGGSVVGTYYNGTVLPKSDVTYAEHLMGHYALVVAPVNFLVYQFAYHASRSRPKIEARLGHRNSSIAGLWYWPTNDGQAYMFDLYRGSHKAEQMQESMCELIGVKNIGIPAHVHLPFQGTLRLIEWHETNHVLTGVSYTTTPELERFLSQYA